MITLKTTMGNLRIRQLKVNHKSELLEKNDKMYGPFNIL
jgi:hypothetical protein